MERLTQPVVGPPLARQRNAVLAILLGLAAAGWAVFLTQASGDRGMHRAMGGPDLTMGGSATLFLGMWVAMMVAMMFPAAAPMILMYARTQANRPLTTAVFTGSYIALWVLFGVLAFSFAVGVERLVEGSAFVARHWARGGGALILLAGVYQLTPLKEVCLRSCRTPLSFLMHSWRDGLRGAARMGLHHGVYCAGCCWLLFLALIPLGVMNVAAMLIVAAVVFAEKVLPRGRELGRVAAVALVVYGAAILARPELLPTVV